MRSVDVDDLAALIRTSLGLEQPLAADTPLISSGLIDSFDIVALLSTLEGTYGVAISPEEIDADTFDTPLQIGGRLESALG